MKLRDDKFRSFLAKLKREDNRLLLEAIEAGFSTLIEGYADLAEPGTSTIDRFNQKASDIAASFGNETLQFLRASAQRMNPRYQKEIDDGLDTIPTNDMSQAAHRSQSVNGYEMHTGVRSMVIPEEAIGEKDEITNSLGLTFDEMNK